MMRKGKLFDIAFILLSFTIFLIMMNTDKHFDDGNFLSRHIWLPLVIAYFIGRLVSIWTVRKSQSSSGADRFANKL